MMKNTGIALILLFSVACKRDGSGSASRIFNPNGDSELALLMREMYDDGMVTKQQIIDGRDITIGFDHKNIHTAEATQPEQVETTDFQVMAAAYEAAVDSLLAADKSERPGAYQQMVNVCAACHSTFCPGPMVKIKHMFLSEKEMETLKM